LERAGEQSSDTPVVASKVVGFTLRVAVLMQSEAAGHALGVLDDSRVIAQEDRTSLDFDSDMLVQHEPTPVGDERLQLRGARMEKVS
jgi:hypothetical protein